MLSTLPAFQSQPYHPHGFCFLWESDLLWTHVVADGLTALAYYSIPVGLVYVTHKRRDIPFDWMFVAFAAFILACGTTHAMAIWNMWHADYWAAAWVKIATAAASIATAGFMIPMIPKVLALPSPEALREKNRELEAARTRITELNDQLRRRVSQLEMANADLKAFSHSVSHDLKAPLRSMEGFSSAVLEDCRDAMTEDCRDYLGRVARGASRLSRLIDDLLEYSKMALTPVPPEDVDLAHVVDDVIASLHGTIEESGARVDVSLQVTALRSHAATLSTILTNLVSNSLTYCESGRSPHVSLSAEPVADGGVCITVSDNGIGIPAKDQARIFNLFERLHGVDQFRGTGVGLAVVVKAVERLGGAVRVESTPGHGSRFSVTLPSEPPA